MIIPYFNTSPKTDILMTFVLTPVWWFLGFGIFIYQLVAALIFLKLWISLMKGEKNFKLPKPAAWFGFFLVSYLGSIAMNFFSQPIQRIFASANNYLFYVMGFFLVLVIYETDAEDFLKKLCRYAVILCFVTGSISVFFLYLWFYGDRGMAIPSLLARLMPSLGEYPFFANLLTLRITALDWVVESVPRLSIYSSVNTATGGWMLMILPLAFGDIRLRGRTLFNQAAVSLGFLALLSSLSRNALCAYVGGMMLVWVLEKKERIFLGVFLMILAVLGSGFIYDAVSWLLEVRSSSTVGRINLYLEAVKIAVEENLWFGIGVRPREEFTLMPLGSHSTYIGLFLVTGLIGTASFVIFQGWVFRSWLSIRDKFETLEQQVLWKSVGASFISVTLWLMVDSVDALPFIAFTYFLVTGSVLLLGRLPGKEPIVSGAKVV